MIKYKPDVVIFEGWCVGVTSKKNLLVPINRLKKKEIKKNLRFKVNKN